MLLMIGLRGIQAADFPTTKSVGIEGVIIPADIAREWGDSIGLGRGAGHGIQDILGVHAQSYWTPSPPEVERVETRLREVLENAAKDPATLEFAPATTSPKYVSAQIAQILSHYGEYRRQYIGLVIDGKRHIYINSFRSSDATDYKKQFIFVPDGGFWFWHIVYSKEDNRFHHLAISAAE
ncbi:MAG: hypothetical protein ABI925_06435 [Verrucomicrobiota bacterium]